MINIIEKRKGKAPAHIDNTGKDPWNKGIKGLAIGTKKGTKFSEEHKKKLSIAASKRNITEETREKLRNRVISDEKRQKLSEKTTAYWAKKRAESQIHVRIS